MKQPDVDEGKKDGLSRDKRVEPVPLRPEKRVLEMEVEILDRVGAPTWPGERPRTMMYPVVRELAADRVPVAVTLPGPRRVDSGYYQWRSGPARSGARGAGAGSPDGGHLPGAQPIPTAAP